MSCAIHYVQVCTKFVETNTQLKTIEELRGQNWKDDQNGQHWNEASSSGTDGTDVARCDTAQENVTTPFSHLRITKKIY